MDDFPPNIPMMINELDRKNTLTAFFLFFVLENVRNTESKKWKWKELTNNKCSFARFLQSHFQSQNQKEKHCHFFLPLPGDLKG